MENGAYFQIHDISKASKGVIMEERVDTMQFNGRI